MALSLSLFLVCIQAAGAQSPFKTIDIKEGGRIVYGVVDGADGPGAGLTAILRMVHKDCGDKPQTGQVFKMRGTDAAGLFFTVVNHPAGNVQVAGLILASESAGPGSSDL